MDGPPRIHLKGWCNDPYERHEHRWLTAGVPSALVGDGGVESQDPPPDVPFVVEPSLVENDSPDGDDLRRSGEERRSDPGQTVWSKRIGKLPWP
jgi:hypothetical protein